MVTFEIELCTIYPKICTGVWILIIVIQSDTSIHTTDQFRKNIFLKDSVIKFTISDKNKFVSLLPFFLRNVSPL